MFRIIMITVISISHLFIFSVSSKTNILLVQGLKKIFVKFFHSPVNAVVDLTFVARKGECFGLLGPNGAGKTTSCRMLTGEIVPTYGDSWILGIRLSKNKNEVCGLLYVLHRFN